MNKSMRCLLIFLLIGLLAGCAQRAEPEQQPTLPPPDTPAGSDQPPDVAIQEPSATSPPDTATPLPTATATIVPTSSPAPTATETATATAEPTAAPPSETAESTTAATVPAADEPTAAPTATLSPPPSATGSTAELVDRGLELDVTGVASMYAWTIERPVPRTGPPVPAHLLMTFDNHEVAEPLARNAPLLAIYPLQFYLTLAGSIPGHPDVEGQVMRLWQLLETDLDPNSEDQGWMPFLPPTAVPIEDWSDFAQVDFIHGLGIRYLRVVDGQLTYTYFGITEDGSYAVTFSWPIFEPDAPDLEALDTMIASLALGEPKPEESE
jgi:hypothetical protein